MNYRKQLQEAERKLLELEQQKQAIEQQMRGWGQIIEGLRVLAEKDNEKAAREEFLNEAERLGAEELSLPNAILLTLAELSQPIGATQIRDQMLALGRVTESKNLLINIHTTLKRLINSKQIEEVPLEDGGKLYKYITPLQRAISLPSTMRDMVPKGRFNQNRFASKFDTQKKWNKFVKD